MDDKYQDLRKQSYEIFELIDCKCWSDADKNIKDLIPKFPNHSTYISELSSILEVMKNGIQATDYINQRKKEHLEKKKQFPANDLHLENRDALIDFEMHIVKPRPKFK